MEPAITIINICGGFDAVAAMTGRSVIRVRRWTYSKERGGSDGLIPSDVAQVLLAEARQRGIALTPAHFFPAWGDAAPQGQDAEDAAVMAVAMGSGSAAEALREMDEATHALGCLRATLGAVVEGGAA